MAPEPTYGGLTEHELLELCQDNTRPRLDLNNQLGMAARDAIPALLDTVKRHKGERRDFYSISITVFGSVPYDDDAEAIGGVMEQLRTVLEPALDNIPGFRPGHPSVAITPSHIGQLHERPYEFNDNPEVQRLRRIEQAAIRLDQADTHRDAMHAGAALRQLLKNEKSV